MDFDFAFTGNADVLSFWRDESWSGEIRGSPVAGGLVSSGDMKDVFPIRAARWIAVALFLCLATAGVERRAQDFADGRVRCVVEADGGEALALATGFGMNAVLRTLPPPDGPATVTIRYIDPPPFYKRWLGAPAAHGWQSGDEIAVRPDSDGVKLAFRLAHEMSHWLVAKTHPRRPPLWLDEGLAQRIGTQAAAAAGRTEKRGLARTPPDGWEAHAHSLDALTALDVPPDAPDAAGAFYWQAERLVDMLCDRLGRDDFLAYLAILSSPDAPPWQAPLRERWWFNDADFEALARAIAPPPQPTAP